MELILIPLILGIYFLPTIIAVKREHPSSDALFFLNLFLGVTVVGWLAAFVWSVWRFNTPRVEENAGTGCGGDEDF